MLFEKYGIKTGNVSLQDIPIANNDYLEPVNEEKKKEKELIKLDNQFILFEFYRFYFKQIKF